MILFVLGSLLMLGGLVFAFVRMTSSGGREWPSKMVRRLSGSAAVLLGFILIIASTAIFVKDTQGGIIIRKFGDDLHEGAIIATQGEKGPQAYVLPPGWHFFYWPWLYDLTAHDNMDIPQGRIGVIVAKDGKPLPDGEVFAPAWKDPHEMIDGLKFLTGNGHKGPQLTVLPPGQYRYNPRLFEITPQPALEVPVGSVAVIKSNAGEFYQPKDGQVVEEVNGVPIVPNGFRGIWRDALQPNAYYMHPQAYVVRLVQTTKRVYSYTSAEGAGNNAVSVKTKDAFEFPVDVRVSVKISAEDAPYVVAMLADPDSDPNKNGFDMLEEKAILPSIRSIFRNTAEAKSALEYLNSRSIIEEDATKQFAEDMKEFKIDVDRVYVAQIGLGDTPEGKELMKTQTDKELAVQQQETFKEQEKAEIQRASMVKAEEDARQEKMKAEAKAKVDIAKSDAQAKKELAIGEAAAYLEKINAFGGVNEYLKAFMVEKITASIPDVKLPNILIIGGGGNGGINHSLLTPVLTEMVSRLPEAQKAKEEAAPKTE